MVETIREPMGVPQSYWQNKTRLQGITAQQGGTRHSRPSVRTAWPTEYRTNPTSKPGLTEVLPAEDSQSTEPVSFSQVLEKETTHENQVTMDLDNTDFGAEVVGPQDEEDSNPGENTTLGVATESTTRL